MKEFLQAAVLLLVIVNPFALSVYLIDILRQSSTREFAAMVLRACAISGVVFGVFAWTGDAIFSQVLQVHFASFQVFGGLLFLLIALRFMVSGGQSALVVLRGEPAQIAGTVAMPFIIGPGTVSAATLAGGHLVLPLALLSIASALGTTAIVLVLLKVLFDRVRDRSAAITERYVEVASRVSAVVVGTIAVEMIFQGGHLWFAAPAVH